MSVDPSSGKPKKNKLPHLEFDFDHSDESEKVSGHSAEPAREPEETVVPPSTFKPFGKPVSTHFEPEPVKSPNPTTESGVPKPTSSGGTALGSFKAQSTAIPKKPISAASLKSVTPEPPSTPPPKTETPMSSQIPSMSDFRRNAERQSREQQSTGSILSGIAYALLAAILIVASLASFGGYVMWRQIQSQATTVAQLSDKLNVEVATLREEAEAARKTSDEVVRRQQEQINRLTSTLEQQRIAFVNEQKKKDRDIQLLQGNVKRLEARFGGTR
jgi:hypothetical protein